MKKSNDTFAHLDRASEAVEAWPEWKKELAGIPYIPQSHPVMISTIRGRGIAVQVNGLRVLLPFEYAEDAAHAILISAAKHKG